jgi:hypothetical protein
LHPLVLFEISTTYNVGLYQNKGPHEAKLSACLNSVKLVVEGFTECKDMLQIVVP